MEGITDMYSNVLKVFRLAGSVAAQRIDVDRLTTAPAAPDPASEVCPQVAIEVNCTKMSVQFNALLAGGFGDTVTCAPQLFERFAKHDGRGTKEEGGNAEANQDVRPTRARPCDEPCRSKNGNVRDQVVSRAQPRRAKVDVICTVTPKKREAQPIGGERESTDNSHGRNCGRGGVLKFEGDLEKDREAKQGHYRAFEQSRAGFPSQASINNEEAETVDK
jgi:hypothetical protein